MYHLDCRVRRIIRTLENQSNLDGDVGLNLFDMMGMNNLYRNKNHQVLVYIYNKFQINLINQNNQVLMLLVLLYMFYLIILMLQIFVSLMNVNYNIVRCKLNSVSLDRNNLDHP